MSEKDTKIPLTFVFEEESFRLETSVEVNGVSGGSCYVYITQEQADIIIEKLQAVVDAIDSIR